MVDTIDFAVTVTLARALRAFGPAKQLEQSSVKLQEMFESNAIPIKYSCVYELTQNSDIHYHIIMKLLYVKKIRSYKIYIENMFRNSKIFGYVCVKPVIEYDIWVDYISKDIQKTYNMLGINPIIHDDYRLYEEDLIFILMKNSAQQIVTEKATAG